MLCRTVGLSNVQTLRNAAHFHRFTARRLVSIQRLHPCSVGALTAEQDTQVDTFIDMLLEQNKVMNLTAVRTKEEAMERHVADSLSLLPVMERYMQPEGDERPSLIDIGSGAGLPGLILAIARPHWQVTLLDSLRKRCNFVEQAAAAIGASNVRVVWGRAETLGQDATHREAYDAAVARAVAELRVLAELSLPFVRQQGTWFAAKGPRSEGETEAALGAIAKLGGRVQGTMPVESFGPEGQREVVIVQKVSSTPSAYPRREGRPQKQPL